MKVSEKKIKVLCFLDNPTGRDLEITLPVAYCMEKYSNCSVEFLFLWDAHKIYIRKPEVILLPNIRGHNMYVEIAEYAHQNDILVLSLDSEGKFPLDKEYDYWGYNTEKKVYQEWVTAWSTSREKFIKNVLPSDVHDKVILTGGTGFDRYIFSSFEKKNLLGSIDTTKFQCIVGYAGWAFGKLHGKHRDQAFLNIHPENPERRYELIESQRKKVRDILKSAIVKFPEVLFLLKKHPKENWESEPTDVLNEMVELKEYDNVIYLNKDFPVDEAIYMSDLWTGFKTTTFLEAWLMSKLTAAITPSDEFPKSGIEDGSIKIKNPNDLIEAVKELLDKGHLKNFNNKELRDKRIEEVKNSIGFDDGNNHIRAYLLFRESLRKIKKVNPSIHQKFFRLYFLMNLGRFFYKKDIFLRLPKFKKTVYVFENRKMKGFEERKAKVYEDLDQFHKKPETREFLKTKY